MGNRDVDFVIRARDEASRAIDAVNASLDALAKAEETVKAGGANVDTLLGQLGVELEKLKAASKGLTGLADVATSMEKLQGVIGGMEAKFASTTAQFQTFAAEVNKASGTVDVLKVAFDKSTASLTLEKETLAKLTAEFKLTADAVAKATATMEAFPAAEQKSIATTEKLVALQDKQAASLDKLRAKLAAKSTPTTDADVAAYQRLEARITSAEAALSKTTSKLDAARSKTVELGAANTAAAASIDGLRQKETELNGAIERSGAAVKTFTSDVAGLKGQLTDAEKRQAQMTAGFSKLLGVLEADAGKIEAAKTAFAAMASEANTVGAKLGVAAVSIENVGIASKKSAADIKLVSDALKGIDKTGSIKIPTIDIPAASVANYKALITQVRESKTAFGTARDEATRLGKEIATAATPTRDLATSFVLAKSNAAQANATFLATGQALGQFRGQASGSFLALEKTVTALNSTGSAGTNAGAGLRSTAGAIQGVASSATGATAGAHSLAGGLTSIYGESRQAMSWLQRLRGELLGLFASYAGVQGLISGFQAVVTAIRAVESATNRISVAFNQNFGQAATAMTDLRVQSLRLGQSFQTTTNEFSKFAIAANEAKFSTEGTDKIFRSISESGRVLKLNTEQLSGVFLALTQMLSKGKVTSEELRRQLGDRLPGAFNIMAKAVGVTTSELDAMMKKGQVLADEKTMTRFAEEMTKSFGAQLPAALKSTSFQLDQFFNLLEQSALRVSEGGFDKGLREALTKLNALFNNRDGRDFFLAIGAAAGRLIGVFGTLAENAGTIARALAALVAIKVGTALASMAISAVQTAAGLRTVEGAATALNTATGITPAILLRVATGFTSLSAASAATAVRIAAVGVEIRSMALTLTGVAGQTNILTRSMAAIGATFTAARVGIAGFGTSVLGLGAAFSTASVGAIAMRTSVAVLTPLTLAFSAAARLASVTVGTLFRALGGIPGILASVAVYFAGEWLAGLAGKVDSTTTAIDEHKRIVEEVGKAYDGAANKASNWQASLKTVTGDQITANVRKQKEIFEAARESAKSYYLSIANSAKLAGSAEAEQVKQLQSSFGKGSITASKFREELEKIYTATKNDNLRQYMEGLLEIGRGAESASQRLSEAADVAKKYGAATPDLGKGVEPLKRTADAAVYTAEMISHLEDAEKARETQTKKTTAATGDAAKGLTELSNAKGGMTDIADAAKKVGDGLTDVGKEGKKAADETKKVGDASGSMDKLAAAGGNAATSVRNVADQATKSADSSVWSSISSAASTAWSAIVSSASSLWSSLTSGFSSAVNSVKGFFADLAATAKGYLDSVIAYLSSVISKAIEAARAVANAASGSGSTTARAEGGPVYGPGTATSDSILARLSTGEFVVRAKAVAAYGLGFLHNVNSMRYMPAYAGGGAVGRVSQFTTATQGALQSVGRPFSLVLDGKTFGGLTAPEDTAQALIRFSRARQARSAGRKPNWD